MTNTDLKEILDNIIRPTVRAFVQFDINDGHNPQRGLINVNDITERNISVGPVFNCLNGLRGACVGVSAPRIGHILSLNAYKNEDDILKITELSINHQMISIPRDNRAYFEDVIIFVENIIYNVTGYESYMFRYDNLWYLKMGDKIYLCPSHIESKETLAFFYKDETKMFDIDGTEAEIKSGMRLNPPKIRGSPKTEW